VSSAVEIKDKESPCAMRMRRIVPTHMLCGLAPTRSIEDLVQMAGRTTYMGVQVLKDNQGEGAKVKILIHHRDWDLAVSYYRFQDKMFSMLDEGKSIQDVLATQGLRTISYDWSCDILASIGKRSIGANFCSHSLLFAYQ